MASLAYVYGALHPSCSNMRLVLTSQTLNRTLVHVHSRTGQVQVL